MQTDPRSAATCLIFTLLLSLSSSSPLPSTPPTVCIIGSGIGGSSVAHFLRRYTTSNPHNVTVGQIRIFERNGHVGGRMATVTIAGETFEAGGSILHPKNYHALEFAKLLNLTVKNPPSSSKCLSLGIWNGDKFLFETFWTNSGYSIVRRFFSLANSVKMFLRYGRSLLRMSHLVEDTLGRFLKYYEAFESRPVFESVEEMLKWAGLYDLTAETLEEELLRAGLSPLLIQELITVITRINYGQSVSISGLAGTVSLAGSGGGLWSIEGGNWQMAAGLINQSNIVLHLNEEIKSLSNNAGLYELNSSSGGSYTCHVAVIATPLDEVNLKFTPSVSVPKRKLQHTFATFVRGCLNPDFFGLRRVSDIPELIGTTETSRVPFSSIGTLKQHNEEDMTYKVFSRQPLSEDLLDEIFRVRNETIRINWAAYPQYHAPERFAPLVLDQSHLYYVNAFENAASTMETSAVSAENVARLIISRLSSHSLSFTSDLKSLDNHKQQLHSDL
ncbi:OLC1v1024846C2 [Oldenlandia corymbosa var. corymbosa]|uniref:OLC1v1024846C2 n=1 Tax=Oldenlandia corymbosa var. corymbosa TaxID=529605 RepID=A0AAV1C442_OLDCO|nr:OLC1v1024846C2 [Oldenlandia corymbosa var. corymbosa]